MNIFSVFFAISIRASLASAIQSCGLSFIYIRTCGCERAFCLLIINGNNFYFHSCRWHLEFPALWAPQGKARISRKDFTLLASRNWSRRKAPFQRYAALTSRREFGGPVVLLFPFLPSPWLYSSVWGSL